MKTSKILPIILFLLFQFLILTVKSQNLTLSETVDYINKKLQENPYMQNDSKKVFSIEITSDNRLITKCISTWSSSWSSYNGCTLYIYVSDLNDIALYEPTTKCIYNCRQVNIGGITTHKSGNCDYTNMNTTDYKLNRDYAIYFGSEGGNMQVYESLRNAFRYLFNKLKEEGRYKYSEDSDPFAPKK